MRILADENIPGDVVEALEQAGHDIVWIRIASPGIADTEVFHLAQRENRVIITFDKDFGELAFRLKLPALSGIILFRLPPLPPAKLAQFIAQVIETRNDWNAHFSVVETDKVRIRPLVQ